MKTRRMFFVSGIVLLSLTLTSCNEDEEVTNPDPTNPQELITKVILSFVESDSMGTATGDTVVAVANDPDGSGTSVEIDTLYLKSGYMYACTIELLDEPNGEDITEEVAEEAEEHQFFYGPGGGAVGRMAVTVTDVESDYPPNTGNLPVGLTFDVEVSAGGSADGFLNVLLSHYDDAPKNGIDPSDESDVDIDFQVVIN